MPWTKKNPPNVAKNWTDEEKDKCVKAANAVLADGGADDDAIFACIHAAGKSKEMKTMEKPKPTSLPLTERRYVAEELRLDSEADQRAIGGYAAVFDSLSEDLGGFREMIRKGTFRRTIRESDIRALNNHNADQVLGRRQAGTLKLAEDDKGLRVKIMPTDTSYARDLIANIDAGNVTQMSFGFRTIKDRWTEDKATGMLLRELLEVRLFDVSPVTFPAYPQTEVNMRAIVDSMLYRLDAGDEFPEEERAAMAHAMEVFQKYLLPETGSPRSADPKAETGSPRSLSLCFKLLEVALK